MARRITVFLAVVVLIASACNRDVEATEVPVDQLRPGDCFNGTAVIAEKEGKEDPNVLVVASLPCSQSHEKEVFAIFEYPAPPDDPFPGEEAVAKAAQEGCAERFPDYVGEPFEDSELAVSVIAPGPLYWNQQDDRTIVCALYGDDLLKGSQKADGD